LTKQLLPEGRPEVTRANAISLAFIGGLLTAHSDPFFLLGRRGYYRDTMGKVGVNELGVYDDAIILCTPTAYVTFNANCDPSRQRKDMASLKRGLWHYKLGIHGLSKAPSLRYAALVQAAPVTVSRHGGEDETGYFGINIHRGGVFTTSSLGCQTIPTAQWASFISLVKSEMTRHSRKTIPYVLTERK
jgi:hypothetical protein